MKKIFNIIFLILICFLPIMVNAKVKLEFKWDIPDLLYLYEEDGKYHYTNSDYYIYDDDQIFVYDNDGKLLKEEKFFDSSVMSEEEFYLTKAYKTFSNKYLDSNDIFDEENNLKLNVNYKYELFRFSGDNGYEDIYFNSDLDYTYKLLGKKYDVFLALKEKGIIPSSIDIIDGLAFVIVSSEEYMGKSYFYVFDSNNNAIITDEYIDLFYLPKYYVYDGLIYVLSQNTILDIYKIDGTKYDTLIIDRNYLKYIDEDVDSLCGDLVISQMEVKDKQLLLYYVLYECNGRLNYDDANDYVKDEYEYEEFYYKMFLKYSLDFDVEKVESNDGKFTYERKIGEDGNEYVELDINPNKGYYIDKIIVTDLNGERIEVTDNKFFMPMSDVKVEILYKYGEYVPIPDTFLGKSVSLIIIGFILIGLGVYTVNYVKY